MFGEARYVLIWRTTAYFLHVSEGASLSMAVSIEFERMIASSD